MNRIDRVCLARLACALTALAAALASTAAVAADAPARAEAPTPITLRLDVTASVFRDAAGRVNGCGLRVFGVEPLPPPREEFRSVDVSMLLGFDSVTRDVGMIKASSFEATPAEVRSNRPTRFSPLEDGWLGTPNGSRSQPLADRPLPQADGASLTYLTRAAPLIEFADAALFGRQVVAGIQFRDAATPRVYVAVPVMADSAKQDFAGCMRALTAHAKAGAGRGADRPAR